MLPHEFDNSCQHEFDKKNIAGRENDFLSNSCEIQINDVFLGLRICIVVFSKGACACFYERS